jgi:hypothetical protein
MSAELSMTLRALWCTADPGPHKAPVLLVESFEPLAVPCLQRTTPRCFAPLRAALRTGHIGA